MPKRTVETKWFTYNQNNSGGYFISNDNVAEYVFIEAVNAEQANNKMGELVEGYSDYCPCCGERWYINADDSDGHEIPTMYGIEVTDEFKPYGRDGYGLKHHFDGTIERVERKE